MNDDTQPLVWAFPQPQHAQLTQAFLNLRLAAEGTEEQRRALGDPTQLPRPWDPASLTSAELRYATWRWLNDFVMWFNHEQAWNPNSLIPACWPQHPHLIHQIAVLADLRRQAGEAFTSQPLEEWHRYAVPAFLDRMRQQINTGCDKTHAEWPNTAKFRRLIDTERDRMVAFNDDIDLMADEDPTDYFEPTDDPAQDPAADEVDLYSPTGLDVAMDAADRIAAGSSDQGDTEDKVSYAPSQRHLHSVSIKVDPRIGEVL